MEPTVPNDVKELLYVAIFCATIVARKVESCSTFCNKFVTFSFFNFRTFFARRDSCMAIVLTSCVTGNNLFCEIS